MANTNPFFLLLLLSLTSTSSSMTTPNPETQALLSFKSSSDPTNFLSTWTPTTSPCSFYGVSCLQTHVSKLVLEDLNLTGPFPPSLLSLSHLRVLSLKHNHFSGPLPDLSSLSSLKLLFLSFNNFSGHIPPSLSSLFQLYRIDISHNSFCGLLPRELNRLSHLLTLRLEHNAFSGEILFFNNFLPNIQDFNVSANTFNGPIPQSLSSFPVSSFQGNAALCGPPLLTCKNGAVSNDPAKPKSGNDAVSSPVVSSSPVSTRIYPPTTEKKSNYRGKMSMWGIMAIILGDILVLVTISLLLYCYFWRSNKKRSLGLISGGEKIVYSTSPYPSGMGGLEREPGRMVFFEGGKKFELEDLLRASAEMLGKGVFGTAYKAVLDDGNVVAVKRLKEAQLAGRKEFEQQMEVLGRLRHPNLVSLKAYYFAPDEKLLVFDYLPNGSLFWLLHGNRGPGRTPLDWTTRLKIAAGAARGLAFIHSSCRALKLIHGNIKSTNILIDKAGDACVSDFGLSSFAPTSTVNPRSNGYRAPESLDGRRLNQKADVYSFGVLLLELLTGKYPSIVEGSGPYGTVGVGGVVDLPRWVQSVVREEWTAEVFDLELMRYKDIEEEMVGLLQIAMACTSASADQRPRMGQVVKMIEEIRGIEVSPSHDNFDSDSPSISEDTGGVSQ
ncbi:probable leucine-rich repeat receptor-like protein kinase At1g68400 [Beta vulgaris subsp. vulgaris]|uniref:probable leucine-rich repeat receptor-like protein kinase At1g68400 n=1 Tax=Beta vulgaris subsp. vulgaris TaxID=3555 RepID=UPI0020372BCF|nr:probable leucine-rich repeat receptor-like protein kinase At1g68400 [Beta vulgaris subsp. vulgaris]